MRRARARIGVRLRHRLRELGEADRGSAVVEFLGVGVLLLIPLVYLVITLAQVQGALFAAEGAAREAGRHLAQAESIEDGVRAARLAVEIAFRDQGLEVDAANVLDVRCSADPCLTPGERIAVEVATEVPLPLVPAFVRDTVPAVVPVSAGHLVAVPQFRESR